MATSTSVRISAINWRIIMDFSSFKWILVFLGIYCGIASKVEGSESYDKLYVHGVDAYNAGKWRECSIYISSAIDERKTYQTILTDCRLKCHQDTSTLIDSGIYLNLAFLDLSLKVSSCVRKCKKEKLVSSPQGVVDQVEEDFDKFEPYNYLQLCAYKLGDLEKAVSSAYTFLLARPDHTTMRRNMEFYKDMDGVRPEFFMDLEAYGHSLYYQRGVDAYANQDYQTAIMNFERSLELYFLEHQRCRMLCEGPYEHDGQPEFMSAVADHYVSILECRQKCPFKLATVYGRKVDNFLPYHFNYLQYSYFMVGELAEACRAAGTYLMFYPQDEEMVGNRAFYLAQDGVTQASFTPRPDVALYHEVHTIEDDQLRYIKQEYTFPDPSLEPTITKQARFFKTKYQTTPIQYGPHDDAYKMRMSRYNTSGINVTLEGREGLLRDHRVVVDNFITSDEAEKLIKLTSFIKPGDGYTGMRSPHTEYEKFEGIGINGAAKLAAQGVIPDELPELYLSVSERLRAFLEDYWNLLTPLYFHYTHLACRTALEDGQGNQKQRKDLSHPIHSDNCHIQQDGSCPKMPPAYYQRDLSAILYLNEEFEGGEFIFAYKNLSTQLLLQPKPGRAVAFEAGDYHGVKAVTKGRRCAVAVWYTMHEPDLEEAYLEAQSILHHAKFLKSLKNSALQNFLKSERDIRVTHTEAALNGPERFAADGLLSRQDCQTLIDLANSGGVQGDGYFMGSRKSKKSPHTTHEMFEGLTVMRASHLAASGAADVEAVELYLDTAERGRDLVAKYFNLKAPLYFDFTHLVCRTALNDGNIDRQDLSHPIHSDNCLLQPDGTCKREAPAYVQRDYSAIIYLNGDFKGGEFFFTHPNLTLQSSVKPYQGMLMGFNAGNLHGVKAVKAGQRCAIALWFTLNPKYNEQAHNAARKILKNLKISQNLHDEL